MANRPEPRAQAKKSLPVRALAALVIQEVVDQGHSLSDVLPRQIPRLSRERDAALLQEICFGSLRWLFRLEPVLGLLLQKPFRAKDRDVHFLLLAALYQLTYMKVPPHAAVKETVDAAKLLGRQWAAGLVNAVLRRFQQEQEKLFGQVDKNPAAKFAHPNWLYERLRRDWPDELDAILEANNRKAPMTLRVNTRKISRDEYGQRLQQAGIAAHISPHSEVGLQLEQAVVVDKLPGFAEGMVSVQDAAAQQAAVLLDAGPGMRVLDACAAPGGKTAHILERYPEVGEVVALDVDEQRLSRVQENMDRLGLAARICQGDAADPAAWWDGRVFDRILLDAPCSATGVIRRHPDIKLLRRSDDIENLSKKQGEILRALWPLLASGGRLVYATCSVLQNENALQLAAFLSDTADAEEIVIEADWGRGSHPGRQVLPGEDDMDGFYYACVKKK